MDQSDDKSKPDGLQRLFGRRQAFKLRTRQAGLMEALLPQLAIAPGETPLDPGAECGFAGTPKEIHLEIGFGGGEHLAALAEKTPENLFIGCEPFVNGMGKMLAHIDDKSLKNIRLYAGDARRLMARLPDGCLTGAYVLFPDPWPKTRHHKRRFIQTATLEELARLLKKGGRLRIASDIPGYISWSLAHIAPVTAFAPTAQTTATRHTRPADWPPTRYEQKALEAGRPPAYLEFERV